MGSVWAGRALDRSRPLLRQHPFYHRREYGMFVVRAIRGIMKIRYLVLGGALGGGVTLQKVFLCFSLITNLIVVI